MELFFIGSKLLKYPSVLDEPKKNFNGRYMVYTQIRIRLVVVLVWYAKYKGIKSLTNKFRRGFIRDTSI